VGLTCEPWEFSHFLFFSIFHLIFLREKKKQHKGMKRIWWNGREWIYDAASGIPSGSDKKNERKEIAMIFFCLKRK
jgi:hypothetical protein